MKKRWVWVGVVVAAAGLAAGGFYYYGLRTRQAAQPQRPRDPGFLVIASIRALERNEETRLTKEQVVRILPFVKALKDVPTSDSEAAAVIARAVVEALTPEQRAALEQMRKRLQEAARQRGSAPGIPGAPGGGVAGPGLGGPGGPGFGPGAGAGAGGAGMLSDEERAEIRKRTFERVIRYLERRARS